MLKTKSKPSPLGKVNMYKNQNGNLCRDCVFNFDHHQKPFNCAAWDMQWYHNGTKTRPIDPKNVYDCTFYESENPNKPEESADEL